MSREKCKKLTEKKQKQKDRRRSNGLFSYHLVSNVRQKCDLSCALDCGVQFALMLCAGARNSSGQDLAALADELSQLCGILVVDEINLICTENADLLSSAYDGTLRACRGVFSSIHCSYPPKKIVRRDRQNGRSSSVLSSSKLGACAAFEENEGVVCA